MKKFLLIPVYYLLMLTASANTSVLQQGIATQQPKDTIAEDTVKEDILIEEVVQSRAIPKKEKVQYFSQVTKYGFKNLFSNYSYNATLPYTAQINPNAELFIQDYMRNHGAHLEKMKSWGMPYFNFIDGILQQYGLPKELKYIAVIESGLSTDATSPVGAGGPWQFMPYTAREFGLTVNAAIDERRDYYKSTHAAARYLLLLYQQMHDWLLVMAAYNGGAGRVYNAIKKSGSRDFWQLQYYLPEESRTYVKRFIATHYIMEGTGGVTTISSDDGSMLFGGEVSRTNYGASGGKNPYNKSLNQSDSTVNVEVLAISGKYNSVVIAKNITMNIIEFNHYNPAFDNVLSSTGNYDLRLPPDKMQLFVANKYQILNECVQLLLGSTDIPEMKTTYPKQKNTKKKAYR